MGRPVLYIDSDPSWMETIAASFSAAEYPLMTATEAGDALAKADTEDLGLILLGLRVGQEPVLNLLRFLRANHPEMPILILGGNGDNDPEVKGLLEAGATGCLEKSGPDELLVALGAYLAP